VLVSYDDGRSPWPHHTQPHADLKPGSGTEAVDQTRTENEEATREPTEMEKGEGVSAPSPPNGEP